MYLASIEPGSYLDFVNPVPFRNADGLLESGLLESGLRITDQSGSVYNFTIAMSLRRLTYLALAVCLLPHLSAQTTPLTITGAATLSPPPNYTVNFTGG